MLRYTQSLHFHPFKTIDIIENKPDFLAIIDVSDFDYRFVFKNIYRFELNFILIIYRLRFSMVLFGRKIA